MESWDSIIKYAIENYCKELGVSSKCKIGEVAVNMW